ncbi:MAG: hypothetical protein ACLSGK_02335 [Lachnospiraceae bacterium]
MAPKENSNGNTLTTFKVIDTSAGLKADGFKLTKVTIARSRKTVDAKKVTAVKSHRRYSNILR